MALHFCLAWERVPWRVTCTILPFLLSVLHMGSLLLCLKSPSSFPVAEALPAWVVSQRDHPQAFPKCQEEKGFKMNWILHTRKWLHYYKDMAMGIANSRTLHKIHRNQKRQPKEAIKRRLEPEFPPPSTAQLPVYKASQSMKTAENTNPPSFISLPNHNCENFFFFTDVRGYPRVAPYLANKNLL